MKTWKDWLDNAISNLATIQTADEKQALTHMLDAYVNLYEAIDALQNKLLAPTARKGKA